MCGWIKIHRDIVNNWIYQDTEKFRWWIDMLFLASYEDNKVNVGSRIVEVKRGQFIGSLSFFMKRWGVGKERIINYLRLLQSDGMIDKVSDKNITLITICNYESYQNVPNNLPDSNSDNLPDNPPDTTKEVKEIINNNNISTTRTRETVRDYAARYVSEGIWIPMACQKTHRKKEVVLAWLDEFVMMLEHNGEQKTDFKDFKDHFWNHIGRRAELERQTERKTGDGSDKRQQDNDRRRGVPAVARSREEYQKPF